MVHSTAKAWQILKVVKLFSDKGWTGVAKYRRMKPNTIMCGTYTDTMLHNKATIVDFENYIPLTEIKKKDCKDTW